MKAREEVLTRIRTALAGPSPPGTPSTPDTGAVPRDYRTRGTPGGPPLLDLLAGRLADYGSTVHRTTLTQLTATIAAALTERGARRIIVPPGLSLARPPGASTLPPAGGPPTASEAPGAPATTSGAPGPALLPHLPAGTEIVTDGGHSPRQLDTFDAVITGAAVAIAETGTIILDGSAGQGRRALTLIPDYHLCILHASQVVALVPEALERLHPDRPLTWISGPSATSDIELDRVQGVHGPRTLDIILAEDPAGANSGPAGG